MAQEPTKKTIRRLIPMATVSDLVGRYVMAREDITPNEDRPVELEVLLIQGGDGKVSEMRVEIDYYE